MNNVLLKTWIRNYWGMYEDLALVGNIEGAFHKGVEIEDKYAI